MAGFGEQRFAREEILSRALLRIPEEEEVLSRAIELGRELPRRPEPPLVEVLPFLVRISSRIAAHLAPPDGVSVTQVKLVWSGPDELLLGDGVGERAGALGAVGGPDGLLPLADWRARDPRPPRSGTRRDARISW